MIDTPCFDANYRNNKNIRNNTIEREGNKEMMKKIQKGKKI